MSMSSFVHYETKNRIGYITLNRPDKRNALNHQFVSELKQTLAFAEKEDNVKAIVIKASGEAFCAGADLDYLRSLQTNTYEENLADSLHLSELYHQVYSLKKVVIAQIEGHAIAGGCGLASVCDFSFSVPEALFGYTEVKIGFIPAIVSVFLLRKIGEGRARQLLLTGELIDAATAQNIGLINYIADAKVIEEKVNVFAAQLCEKTSAQSLSLTKKLMAEIPNLALPEALNYAAKQNAEARSTEDCKKGISAFLNKEKKFW